MRSTRRIISLLLILLTVLTLGFIHCVIAQAPPPTTITIESPNSVLTYGNTIPIKFKVANPSNSNMYGPAYVEKISYILDGNQPVDIMNFGQGWAGGYSLPIENTTTLYNVSDGQHKLQLVGEGYYINVIGVYGYNFSSSITNFTVNVNPSTIPTQSVPELTWLTILPILLTIPIALAIVRKRLQRNV